METDNGTHVKIISPTVHGIFDYVAVAVLLVAPSVFGLTGVFAYGAYGLAAAHFLLTITTRFAAGLFPVLSFRVHGVLELMVALGMVVSPWLFQFANQPAPRNFFLLFGTLLIGAGFFTHYQPQKSTDTAGDSQDSPAVADGGDNHKDI